MSLRRAVLSLQLLSLISGLVLIGSDAADAAPGGSKPAVVRGGVWFLKDTQTTGNADTQFGYGDPGDVHLMGDWDGNGSRTPGVVRGNVWYLSNVIGSSAATVQPFVYGDPGDQFVAGDWDGDGDDTPGAHRGDRWYLRNENTQGIATVDPFQYGDVGDLPIVGDWNGDNATTVGVVRSAPSVEGCPWHLSDSNVKGVSTIHFGFACPPDRLLVGDWDRDGDETPGFVRGLTWNLRNELGPGVDVSFGFGDPRDEALVWQ